MSANWKNTGLSAQEIVHTLFLTFLFLVETRSESNTSCDLSTIHPSTQLYALSLSSTEYSPLQSTSISVRVYTTTCSSIDTRGPSWYRLEAISQETETLEGVFDEPPLRSEALLVGNSDAIEFLTSEPIAISDLPRTYKWKRKNGNVGEICFRLTLLADDNESKGCRQTKNCISPSIPPTEHDSSSGRQPQKTEIEKASLRFESEIVESMNTPMPSTTGLAMMDQLSKDSKPSKTLSAREKYCYTKKNCTNAKLRDFCVSDGNTYPSRCAMQLQECLQHVNLDIIHRGKCIPPVEPTPCWEEVATMRDMGFMDMWTSKCTRRGGYKPTQCHTNRDRNIVCWCSTMFGHASGEAEVYNCSRPESFYQFNRCLQLENR